MDIRIKSIDNEKSDKEKESNLAVNYKLKFLMDNDELWNICTFIMVFIVMLILSYFNIYGVTDSVVYSFSFASLILSTSQIIKSDWNKVFYMIGHIILILGGGIDIKIIESIKSVLNENTLLILSLIVVFIGFLFNKINTIEENKKKDIIKNEINLYLDYLNLQYSEDKKNVLNFVSEMRFLIEASDVEMTDKVMRSEECYKNIEDNSEYIKSIEFIRLKIDELLDAKVDTLNK